MIAPRSAQEIRALAARLVTDDLVVLPVRHHSPACARQVRRAIRESRPSVVLVEGPRTFDPLVPLLAHPEAQMPLAVYTWSAGSGEGERLAAYYPFCDYSPELVAIREGLAADTPVRFIDLDLVEQAATARTRYDDPRSAEPEALTQETHYRHSAALQLLAERLGCRDHEDLWERLFEAVDVPLTEHVAQVAAYCLLARDDRTEGELEADGTAAREAEMAHHVREVLASRREGEGPVLVVLGGFHAVALPDLLAAPPGRPEVVGSRSPAESALIRYGFDRLERLNGYAAGMTSPAWHQRLWDHTGPGHPREVVTLQVLLDVAEELRRRHHMPVPVPSVSAAYGQALQLARLRGRDAPLRTDLLDALTSCLVKGDVDVEGHLVSGAAARVLVGDRIGRVPPGAGTPPLVADTLARLRAQRLRVDEATRSTAALDIYRRESHRETSRLLHGLGLLEVPFAIRTAGPDFVNGTGLGRLQERWYYAWTPATEGALVEASLHGPTLPEAIASRFDDLLVEQEESGGVRSAAVAVGLLTRACLLGLHTRLDRTLLLVRAGVEAEPSFPDIVAALGGLALLGEAREPLAARGLDALPALLSQAWDRAIYLARDLRAGECEPRAAAEALVRMREVLVSATGSGLDETVFWQVVERLRVDHDDALVRGAATGLLHAAGRLSEEDFSTAVTGHLRGTVPPDEAVGFISGVLLTARETAWQDGRLVSGIDDRLRAWDDETFVRHLPDLRLAFAALTPLETDRVAEGVAALHGIGSLDVPVRRDVDQAEVTANLALAAEAAHLLDRDGLADWRGAR